MVFLRFLYMFSKTHISQKSLKKVPSDSQKEHFGPHEVIAMVLSLIGIVCISRPESIFGISGTDSIDIIRCYMFPSTGVGLPGDFNMACSIHEIYNGSRGTFHQLDGVLAHMGTLGPMEPMGPHIGLRA